MEDERAAHPIQDDDATALGRLTGEFAGRAIERTFRERLLRDSGERVARSGLWLAALFVAFTLSDLSTMGMRASWWWLLTVRLFVAAAIVAVSWGLRHRPTWFAAAPGTWWLAAAQVSAVTGFLVVCWARPEDVVIHSVSTVVLTLVLVVFVPGPMRHKIALTCSFHGAFLAVLALRVADPLATVSSLTGLLAASSLTTFTVAANLNRALRTEWRVSSEQREVNARLLEEARRSELLRAELHRQATQDPLTGLSNRRSFLSRGEEMVQGAHRHGRPLTALLMDADGFKQINDGYGHAAGDAVLSAIGAALASTARRGELVGRIGGEEFAVVAEGLDLAGAESLAQRLRRAIHDSTVEVDGERIGVTVSIGFTQVRSDETLASALGRADRAMYQAKASGGDRVLSLVA